jgi:hypothetical protein
MDRFAPPPGRYRRAAVAAQLSTRTGPDGDGKTIIPPRHGALLENEQDVPFSSAWSS